MSDSKRAYDAAAEAFCDHVLECVTCTMTGPHCAAGNDLLRAENETWNAYRERARDSYRPQIYADLGGVIVEDWG